MSLMIFLFHCYTTSKTNGSSKMEGIINEINIYNAYRYRSAYVSCFCFIQISDLIVPPKWKVLLSQI